MLYSEDIIVPANTTRAKKTRTRTRLWKGVLHRFRIDFPFGCNHLVHAHVNIGGHQIIPINDGTSVRGNGFPVEGKMFLELKEEQTPIAIYTWNDDDTYQHIITVSLYVLPKWVLLPQLMMVKLLESLQNLFLK